MEAPVHTPVRGTCRCARGLDFGRGLPIAVVPPSCRSPPAMDAVSLSNVNASAPPALDHGPQAPLKKAVGQDDASALALLSALPAPALATAGMLGTQLDAWA